jgi:hypothetical protein
MAQAAGPRTLAIAFVAGLAVLSVQNVYWLVRNQTELSCQQRVCVWPRALYKVASQASSRKARVLAIYHLLNQKIPDATLTIPRWMAGHKWSFEHLAGVHVQISPEPLRIDNSHTSRLKQLSQERDRLARRVTDEDGRRRRRYQHIHFYFDKTATDYVIAEVGAVTDPIFLLPRAEYERVAQR